MRLSVEFCTACMVTVKELEVRVASRTRPGKRVARESKRPGDRTRERAYMHVASFRALLSESYFTDFGLLFQPRVENKSHIKMNHRVVSRNSELPSRVDTRIGSLFTEYAGVGARGDAMVDVAGLFARTKTVEVIITGAPRLLSSDVILT